MIRSTITASLILLLAMANASIAQCPNGRCQVPAPAASLYELADSGGQKWRHADPAYLSKWVAARDKTPSPPTEAQQQAVALAPIVGDVYGFGQWVNAVRARSGLRAIAHDPGLSNDATINSSRGFGHSYMGGARRQNAGVGPLATVESMWLASPPHASAILDPSITAYGIAQVNGVWTYSAR